MKINILVITILLLSFKVSCQSFCGNYIKIYKCVNFSDFEKGISINANSTFTFLYKSDSSILSATGTYTKKHRHIFLKYSTPDYLSIAYDTIKSKLEYDPPIIFKTIVQRKIKNPDSDNWPIELLIMRGKLRIAKYKNCEPPEIIEFRKCTLLECNQIHEE